MFVKNIVLQISFYAYKLMWEYLERNFKADVNILVLYYTWESTETGAVTQRSLYRDLFNQNGMDFVPEYLQ